MIAVDDSPKLPPVRLTMTLALINRSREVHFLVSGNETREALSHTLKGYSPPLPAERVRPVNGGRHWWVDQEAAGEPTSAGTERASF